jgi:hypothetical protein
VNRRRVRGAEPNRGRRASWGPARLALAAVCLAAAVLAPNGCEHEVRPTAGYDESAEIPPPRLVEAIPGLFGPLIVWQAPDSDFVVVQGWHVYRRRPDGDERRITPEPVQRREFQDIDTPLVGDTFYWVTAVSRAGVESPRSQPARLPWDDQPPAPPTGLVAFVQVDRIELAWDIGDEPDLAGYRVYRDGALIGAVGDPAMPVFFDFEVVSGTDYRYWVTARDLTALESAPGDTIDVRFP